MSGLFTGPSDTRRVRSESSSQTLRREPVRTLDTGSDSSLSTVRGWSRTSVVQGNGRPGRASGIGSGPLQQRTSTSIKGIKGGSGRRGKGLRTLPDPGCLVGPHRGPYSHPGPSCPSPVLDPCQTCPHSTLGVALVTPSRTPNLSVKEKESRLGALVLPRSMVPEGPYVRLTIPSIVRTSRVCGDLLVALSPRVWVYLSI